MLEFLIVVGNPSAGHILPESSGGTSRDDEKSVVGRLADNLKNVFMLADCRRSGLPELKTDHSARPLKNRVYKHRFINRFTNQHYIHAPNQDLICAPVLLGPPWPGARCHWHLMRVSIAETICKLMLVKAQSCLCLKNVLYLIGGE
jgi:hypothetical protein